MSTSYHIEHGAVKRGKGKYNILLIVCLVAVAIGIYILFLTIIVPRIPTAFTSQPVHAASEPQVGDNRLYIPKIGVNLKINTGGVEALNNGVWHRYPERGDPAKGGNFIIAGHRFSIAFTPQDVVEKSPLYNADKLEIGDQMAVNFDGKRYIYVVAKKYTVKPTQISIEDPSPDDPHMTLYTCTLGGEADGRLVIIAKLLGQSS